jgi:hypothetical protein
MAAMNPAAFLGGLANLTAQLATNQQALLKQQQDQHDRDIEVRRMEDRTKALIEAAFDPTRSAAFCRQLSQHSNQHLKDAEHIALQAVPLSLRDTFADRVKEMKALCTEEHYNIQALLQVVYDMKANTCFEQKHLLQERLQASKLQLTSLTDVQAFLAEQLELFKLKGFLQRIEAWENSPTRDPGQAAGRTFPSIEEQPRVAPQAETTAELRARKEKEFVEHVFSKCMSPDVTMAIKGKLNALN